MDECLIPDAPQLHVGNGKYAKKSSKIYLLFDIEMRNGHCNPKQDAYPARET
jgi:hypothetical protein